MSLINQFSAETTIHGFAETARYKKSHLKWLWITIGLVTYGIFAATLIKGIQKYMDKPTASIASFGHLDEFPEIAICPKDWIDFEKAKNVGLQDDDSIAYVVNFVCPFVPRPFNFVPTYQITDEKLAQTRKNVLSVMKKFGNRLTPLLFNITVEPYEGMLEAEAMALQRNVSYTTIMKHSGPCWLFQPGGLLPPVQSFTKSPRLQLTIKNQFPANQISLYTMYPGPAANAKGMANGYSFPARSQSLAAVRAMVIKRLKSCNATKGHSDDVCDAVCSARLGDACGTCQAYLGDVGTIDETTFPYCNGMDPDTWGNISESDMTCLFNKSHMCEGLCQSPCQKISVATVMSKGGVDPENNDTVLHVSVENAHEALVIEDYYSYELLDLLGDVGGYLGLFLGASVLSLIHLIFFWFLAATGGCSSGTVKNAKVATVTEH